MTKSLVNVLKDRWKSYRHRFVPWIALNLGKNERTLRHVQDRSKDKQTGDDDVLATLTRLFTALLRGHAPAEHELTPVRSPRDTTLHALGFCIEKMRSSLPAAGTGVFVTRGRVPKGAAVAMYPGTIYQAYEPIFFQSIRNPFVFRCIDGVLIDGNDKGLSKLVFRSCSGRDRVGPFTLSDSSWLTSHPENPVAIGQYVNNCSNENPANVCYQEFDVPDGFPIELRQYLPNVNYSTDTQRPLRCVILVSLRDIDRGEELFSNYYTIVN